ncbi:hypothetical protein [Pseudomonas asplenii]|uniref:hypothetical protein n=1 Tax=Pseudomonas asplenii TaxID=53407 RepID=UPI0012F9C361|nr:hypothetical protein [Pseudomonas fuscovaginae]
MSGSGRIDSSSAAFINAKIDRCNKLIESCKESNKSLENTISHVRNTTNENGYLRLDAKLMPYLKKELTIGTLMIRLHLKEPQIPEKTSELYTNLKFGKFTSKKDVISNLEDMKQQNDNEIKLNKEIIRREKEKLPATQEEQKELHEDQIIANDIREPDHAQTQERLQTIRPPSLETIDEQDDSIPDGNTSPKPAPRTKREDGSPIPTRRTDHEHLDALRTKIGTSSKSEIFENILKMQCEKLDAEKFENNLYRLKKQFDSAQYEPNERYLRFSNEKGLYLSTDSGSGDAFKKHDGGASKLKERIPGLDLGVGQATNKKEVSARIDQFLSKQRAHIDSLGESIERHRTELAFLKSRKTPDA